MTTPDPASTLSELQAMAQRLEGMHRETEQAIRAIAEAIAKLKRTVANVAADHDREPFAPYRPTTPLPQRE